MIIPLPLCLVCPLVLFPLIGYAILETRDDDKHVTQNPVVFILKFVFLGVGLVSEPLALYVFLVEGDALPIAVIIIFARLNHILVSCTFMRSLFMEDNGEERCLYLPGLSTQLDWNCYVYNGVLYRLLLCIGTVEVTTFLYLPWTRSKFSNDPRSDRSPTYQVFAYIFYVKAFRAIVGVVTQAVWLAYSANIKPPMQVLVVSWNFAASVILLGMRLRQCKHFRHNEENCELYQRKLAVNARKEEETRHSGITLVKGLREKGEEEGEKEDFGDTGGKLYCQNPMYDTKHNSCTPSVA